MKNIVAFEFSTSTSTKWYMSGFNGFVASIMKLTDHWAKATSSMKNPHFDSSAIETDYSNAIAPQIAALMLDIILETQVLMLQLMEVLGFDIHKCEYNKPIIDFLHQFSLFNREMKESIEQEQEWNNIKEAKEKEMHDQQAQRDIKKVADEGCALAESAKEICNIDCDVEDEDEADAANILCAASRKQSTIKLVQQKWILRLIHCHVRNEGPISSFWSATEQKICELGQKVSGTFLPSQKGMSLKGRWFQVMKEEVVQQQGRSGAIGWGTIFVDAVGYYRVLYVYRKSYNKWWYEDHIDLKSKKSI
jgi:hypothetical protein